MGFLLNIFSLHVVLLYSHIIYSLVFERAIFLIFYFHMQEHPEWEIKNGSVYFQKVKEVVHKEIPSLQLINQTLGYARELERIV